MNLELHGPFWSASIEVVELASPTRTSGLRSVFQRFSGAHDESLDRRAGAQLLLGRVTQATLDLPTVGEVRWESVASEAPPLRSTDEVATALARGEVVLLLTTEAEDGEHVCTMGELPLDGLDVEPASVRDLFSALGVDRRPAKTLESRSGPARLRAELALDASGLSLFGSKRLAWQAPEERVHGPMLLSHREATSTYELALDLGRFTESETDALARTWREFTRIVNPGREGGEVGPAWVNFETTSDGALPGILWRFDADLANADLQFEVGRRSPFSLLLTDRQPYDAASPPRYLARSTPEDVTVREEGGRLVVTAIAKGAPGAADVAGSELLLVAHRADTDAAWTETGALSDLALAFDPLRTPERIRTAQDLPEPRWNSDADPPVDPPLLFAHVPLEEGWAEIPVPNLTEQTYLDAELEHDGVAPASDDEPPLLQGAVLFGNDASEHTDEQTWSVLVSSVTRIAVTLTLERSAGAGPRYWLKRIRANLESPGVVVDGVFWMSAEGPTAADALPTLDAWTRAVQSVPLRTLHDRAVVFPPLARIDLDTLAFSRRADDAELGTWSFDYRIDRSPLVTPDQKRLLTKGRLAASPARLWLRHARLPFVQALPLTQSLQPPHHPSASRQLYPFDLRDSRTRLGAEGAARWPSARFADGEALATNAQPAHALADLPMVSLSLPGLALDRPGSTTWRPGGDAHASMPLDARYRLDLPYTDEGNALAQLDAAAPAPDAEPERPLSRDSMPEHWRRLSEKASLAAADAVDAVRASEGALRIENLIEPWFTKGAPRVDLDRYPGELELLEGGALLSGDAALRGIDGTFDVDAASGELRPVAGDGGERRLVAGSQVAHRDAEGWFHDQRGLARSDSRAAGSLIRTPIRLRLDAGGAPESYELVSLRSSSALRVVDGTEWRLWFRDLPVREGAFKRSDVRSDRAEDANDPLSTSRELDARAGYEWRLGEAGASERRLDLFGLWFFPLSLESVGVGADFVRRVVVVGRVQLPLRDGGELPDVASYARLVFRANSGGALGLESVSLVGDEAVWPLALDDGESSCAPRLVVDELKLGSDGARLVATARARFVAFGTSWDVPLDEPLQFVSDGAPVGQKSSPNGGVQAAAHHVDASIRVEEIDLRLNDSAAGLHRADLVLAVRLGRADRPVIETRVRYELTGDGLPRVDSGEDTKLLAAVSLDLFEREEVDAGTQGARPGTGPESTSVQFAWGSGRGLNSSTVSLLPGMTLDLDRCPGFAAFDFEARAQQGSGIPALHLRSCSVEAVLFARWGESLQASTQDATPERVFGSSAGDLSIGFTASWTGAGWSSDWLLNGFVEVKNLASWPFEATQPHEEGNADLGWWLPPVTPTTRLAHTRHTVRVLFDQHRLPPGSTLAASSSAVGAGDSLLDLDPSSIWTVDAIVEHQLCGIDFDSEGRPRVLSDRRWTSGQTIRVSTPARWRSELEAGPSTSGGPEGPALFALWDSEVRASVSEALDAAPPRALVIDASTAHWVRRKPMRATNLTGLAYLPNGNVRGVLADLGELGPSDPHDPEWMLLTLPVLGRLHEPAHEVIVAGEVTDPSSPAVGLVVDPIVVLRASGDGDRAHPLSRMLSGWRTASEGPLHLRAAAIDTPSGRTWARLDPASLEESWARSHTPVPAARGGGLPSVLAVAGDAHGRHGRPEAVARNLDSRRPGASAELVSASWAVHDAAIGTESEPLQLLENPDFAGVGTWRATVLLGSSAELTGPWLVAVPELAGKKSTTVLVRSTEHVGRTCLQVEAGAQAAKTGPGSAVALMQERTLGPGRYSLRAEISTDRTPDKKWSPKGFLSVFAGDEELVVDVYGSEVVEAHWQTLELTFELGDEATIDVGVEMRGSLQGQRMYVRGLRLETAGASAPSGWHHAIAQLRGPARDETFHSSTSPGPLRFAAVAALAPHDVPDSESPRPLALAVSPYAGLAFEAVQSADLAAGRVALVSAELLCLDVATGLLRSTATHSWEGAEVGDGLTAIADARRWGLEVHRRLVPESPIAVLRFRRIHRRDGAEVGSEALVDYAFETLSVQRDRPLTKRVVGVRTRVPELRFAEPSFGGCAPPEDLRVFELVPPATIGVQPIHDEAARPWGLDGTRFAVRTTPDARGVAGNAHREPVVEAGAPGTGGPVRELWWQAAQQRVQFRAGSSPEAPSAGLPPAFRARAIRSMHPVSTAPELPGFEDAELGWQPVLPGEYAYLSKGSRSGVPVAVRHQVLHQTASEANEAGHQVTLGGSVPVQHRTPRPVALPANDPAAPRHALRPWADAFRPTAAADVRATPADTWFFAAPGAGGDATGGRLELRAPLAGVIDRDWDGVVALGSERAGPLVEHFEATLVDEGLAFALRSEPDSDHFTVVDPEAWSEHVRSLPGGHALELRVLVGVAAPGDPSPPGDGFRQALSFPLVVVDRDRPRLPLEPRFVSFEDPEYNRRLASTPGSAAARVATRFEGAPAPELIGVTLATDRKEYDPSAEMALRFDWDEPSPKRNGAEMTTFEIRSTATLRVERVGPDGVPVEIVERSGVSSGELVQIALPRDPGSALRPGDRLQVTLNVDEGAAITRTGTTTKGGEPSTVSTQGKVLQARQVVLALDVVREPVVPTPESAYALLRSTREGSLRTVECSRFAWGPKAARVELVCPDDLRAGVVRRRATFRWSDTVRSGRNVEYAIQKLTRTGSTHVPATFVGGAVVS